MFFLLLIAAYTPLSALCTYSIDGKVSYVWPHNSSFRKTYGESAAFGVEAALRWQSSGWETFVGLETFRASGRIHVEGFEGNRSSIHLIPFTVGIKKWFCFHKLAYYIGAGGVLDHVAIKNESTLAERKIRGNSLGATVLVGSSFRVFKDFAIGGYTQYVLQDYHLAGSEDLRGFTFNLSRAQIGLSLSLLF